MRHLLDTIGVSVIFGLLLMFFSESSWSQTPDQLIVDAVTQMYDAAIDPRSRTDPEVLAVEVVLPLLASNQISRQVMGKHWRVMTDKQRTRFLELFPKLIVQLHTKALERLGEATIYFPQNRKPVNGKVVVKMEVRFEEVTHKIEYLMKEFDGEWKVYDMQINDIGMITTYRTKLKSTLSFVPRALLPSACLRVPRSEECIQGKMEYLLDGLDRKVNPIERPDN